MIKMTPAVIRNMQRNAPPGYVEVETTVCGGFPVVAMAKMCPPERDVGIMDWYLNEILIMTVRYNYAPWIEKKMTELDWESVRCDLYEKAREERF